MHPNPRQRVLAAIETLGFVPDASARGLTRLRKDVIALAGLDRSADEIDIERSSLLFIDYLIHAAEADTSPAGVRLRGSGSPPYVSLHYFSFPAT